MGKLKGQNLRVKYGKTNSAIVAAATACTIHVAATLEDSSTKDDTASWSSQECTGKSWDISSDALVEISQDNNGGDKIKSVLDLIGETVAVEFGIASGDNNQTVTALYTGNAIVNDVSINATNKQNVSYTVQMQGVGALAKSGGA